MKHQVLPGARGAFRYRLSLWCLLLLLPGAVQLFAQQMIHRYSFDNDARDLVSGADGELIGGATIEGGAVVLSGTKPSYVNLPNDLFSGLTNVTFELWVTWNGGPVWQRIWDFGNSTAAEDLQGAAAQSTFLTPNNGGGMHLSVFPDGIANQQFVTGPALAVGGLHQIAWTYDAVTRMSILYLDGIQAGINTNMTYRLADLGSTVNNWLGHSQYVQDADFSGAIAEFRIYDGPLTATTVAENFVTGPDPTGRGALVSITLAGDGRMRPGAAQQLRLTGDFEKVSNLDITIESGVSYQVSDTSVFSVSPGGLLTSVGSAAATAVVTANYQGKSSVVEVQVVPSPAAVLIHRYGFTDDASDSVGDAHGELIGDATISQGAVVLSGNKPSYVNLPNDLFVDLADASLEVWFIWNGGPAWQRIWDFGNSSSGEDRQGSATASIFLTPDNGGGMQWSIFPTTAVFGQQLLNTAAPSRNAMHHLVWTYDELTTTGTLYVDGVQVAINRAMTAKPSDLGLTANNWLGHSQYTQDADFAGSIAEFRIYNGTMTAAEVQANFTTGPNPSGRGALLSITVEARPAMLPHQSQRLIVKGDFENVAGVDITSELGLSFQVADASVFSVSDAGVLTSMGAAEASSEVTASFQGKTSKVLVRVIPPVAPVLIHRYSFAGDASDSVGSAHGILVGDTVTEGDAVILTGVKPSYVDLPNDLLDTLTDVTLELWVTWNGAGVWERILDFGSNDRGEDLQGTATRSLFLTPFNGGVMALSIFPAGIGGQQVIHGAPLTAQVEHHVVWTHSAATTTSRLFVDGVESGSNNGMTYTLADLAPLSNVWLGHSQYVQDADFGGSIAEFRVYRGTFQDADVASSMAAGPDLLASEADARRLTVKVDAGAVTISWPAATTGYALETSPALGAAAVWSRVAVEASNTVTVSPGGTSAFYRLVRVP